MERSLCSTLSGAATAGAASAGADASQPLKKLDEEFINGRNKRKIELIDFFALEKQNQEARRALFTIKKKLYQSDVDSLSRLLVSKELVRDHIKPFLTEEQNNKVEYGEGTKVVIKDLDTLSSYTNSVHQLTFKKWPIGYVLIDNWIESVVKRRSLKPGDEIGMYWDASDSRFAFSVFKRA